MRRTTMMDAALILTIGLWVAMGGYLFGDLQPGASAGWNFCSTCQGSYNCPTSVGPCLGCTAVTPHGLCGGAWYWVGCWDDPGCPGLTAANVPCNCRQQVCY